MPVDVQVGAVLAVRGVSVHDGAMSGRSLPSAGLVAAFLLLGCGGSTAGTGEEPADTGSLLDDTGADGTTGDTGKPDDSVDVASETGADTVGDDTTAGDSTAADTASGDAADSFTADSADSSAGDSGDADTGTADTGTDTGAGDTGTADTGTADTGTADTGTADAPTDTGTTGLYPATGKISCSGDGSLMCTGGKICCGRYAIPAFKWTVACESGCLGGRGFDCDETADCSGKICCANTPPFSSSIEGSSCRSDCGGDPQLCMKDSDCTSPKKCVPIKTPDLGTAVGSCK